jgi:Family of unknown function (DUF5675)
MPLHKLFILPKKGRMELTILRTYQENGTNGELLMDGVRQCFTIELPWRDNVPILSCIPEGRYKLAKRYSKKYKDHLILLNVPDRSFILLHPANDALKELAGCIAPVSRLTGPGKGLKSRLAFEMVRDAVYQEIEAGNEVFITITKAP